jgi:beta-galactosidase
MNHTTKKLHFGASYYPEHWDEARWPEDIRMMKEAGFTAVRMGEFAWSTFEPVEGEFHFDWLDHAIALLAENGIATVVGTPTAGPPAWLTQKYPKTLAVDENGRTYEHGQRCHYCVNSPEYHERTRSLVEKMAEHFGSNPNVIGWQFDNEFNTVCYCDTCRAAFQKYLMERFVNLDSLNEQWTTAYWSQTYSDWAQIPIPKSGHNPGLMLAFQQFVTQSYKNYQKLQSDILRNYIPAGVWTTHNFMGWFPTFDHYELSADLDMVSWDWYVGTGHHDHLVSGATHDLTRGFKRRNFWLIETQPGNVNWSQINNQVNQGEARAMAWHAIGHGADAIHYWQWRSAYNGQEQYHGSLVDQSGQPRSFYFEAAQLGREIAKVSELLAGSEIKAKVAILNDYNSRWSLNWQRQHKDFDYVEHLRHYYKPLAERNIPVDIISADAPLDGYRLVIAPALVILTPERVQRLTEFVERGGNLVLTLRSGMKDQFNSLLPQRQPGDLSALTNAEVEEYYPLETPVPVVGKSVNGESRLWAERLRILDTTQFTQVVARYGKENGWLDDQVAITVNPKRNATAFVYYVGTYLDEAAQSALMDLILTASDIQTPLQAPQGVEICQRVSPTRDGGEKIYIIINHRKEPQRVTLPWKAHEHLSDTTCQGELALPTYGVAILTRDLG